MLNLAQMETIPLHGRGAQLYNPMRASRLQVLPDEISDVNETSAAIGGSSGCAGVPGGFGQQAVEHAKQTRPTLRCVSSGRWRIDITYVRRVLFSCRTCRRRNTTIYQKCMTAVRFDHIGLTGPFSATANQYEYCLTMIHRLARIDSQERYDGRNYR
ncbi:hypothetical protein EVAR_5190_1 [Eumeta japonica]|uniref:Uncharacterized protein n=1 Tax=Eumeta variegata TaxID=151549 RepID=A0A4C1V4N6_EUMVA|nr:hypothetical protein EVAR_5190_1 [Eumeta japonica]